MTRYLLKQALKYLLPFFLLFLIVLQNRISDIFFSGVVGVEISMVLVIYAGFRLDVIKGGIISFLLGFFLDCMTGSISGLHTVAYVVLFLVSLAASQRISLDRASLIMLFTLVCALLKDIIITVLYPLIYRIDISVNVLKAYIPQILIVILISPLLFHIFHLIEAFINGENAKQTGRT